MSFIKKIYHPIAFIIISMLLIGSITSCQPTPDELIVQSKADGELMEKINNTPEVTVASQEVTPSQTPVIKETPMVQPIIGGGSHRPVNFIEKQIKLEKGLEINISAHMLFPNADALPVVKYRRKKFDQSDLDKVLALLTGGKQLLEYDIPTSKAEYEELILIHKQILKTHDLSDDNIELISNEIDWLTKCYNEAPDALANPAPHSGKLDNNGQIFAKVRTNNGYAEVHIVPQISKDSERDNQSIGIRYSITGRKDTTIWHRLQSIRGVGGLKHSMVQPRPAHLCPTDSWSYSFDIEPVENAVGHINMTVDEAKKMAEEIFREMGAGDDVKVSNIYYINIPKEVICPKDDLYCYAVELKRYVIDGVPLQSLMSSTQGMPKRAGIDNFNAGVPQETMSIILSDNGIVDIEWREPLERVDVMNPDIELAPCNEVMDVFYQELSNAYGSWETSNEDYISKDRYGGTVCWHSHAPSKLYDIRLDYGLARIPNNNREFMAIPLWDFYSRLNLKKTYTSSNGAVTKCEWVEESSLLTLNGIDNTRFNRREGY